ncbi:MAG: sialidase family protein [Formosimonas sp.]
MMRKGFVFVAIALIFVWAMLPIEPKKSTYQSAVAQFNHSAPAYFSSHFASSKTMVAVHAASSVELSNGDIRAFWFSGSKEGAADVTINSAVFQASDNKWSAETVVTSREVTQAGVQRYVSKLGNPVAMRAPNGQLWLFYVTVSLGGWAGSSITLMRSNDDGATWGAPQRLISSPFGNVSTLIKGAPFLYADGTVGLPVYHEFIGKFPEVLRINAQGQVVDKQRLAAAGYGAIQPVFFIQNASRAMVLTRNSRQESPRQVKSMRTEDAGVSWAPIQTTSLPNSDSALAALVLDNGDWLLVLNQQEQGRDSLSLLRSQDAGASWHVLRALEDERDFRAQKPIESACVQEARSLLVHSDAQLASNPKQLADYVTSSQKYLDAKDSCNFEFSYPYLLQSKNGDIHLLYTWNRTFIKHLQFNVVWLNEQGSRP